MKLASHYRVAEPLSDWLGKFTRREIDTRLAWLDAQWDAPATRTEYYLMQIAKWLREIWALIPVGKGQKKRASIKLESMKIPFIRKQVEPQPSVVQQQPTSQDKQQEFKDRWLPHLNRKSQKRKR